MSETKHKTTIEVAVDDRDVEQLQKQLTRTFDAKAIDAFQRGVERATRSFEKMADAAKRAGFTGGSVGGSPGFASGGAAAGGGGTSSLHADLAELRKAIAELADSNKKANERETRRDRDETARGGGIGHRVTSVANAAGAMGSAAMTGGFVGQVANSVASLMPFVGPAIGQLLSAAAQQSVALYQEYAQQQMAQAGVFGRTGLTGGYVSAGAAYGLQPGQMPGLVASFAGTSGLQGDALQAALPQQLALSQLLGVERAGSIVGAAQSAGGAVNNPSELMLQAVSEGLAAGIRETRLDQYLQNVSGWVEGVRSQGIDMSPESALRMVAGMHSAGLQGEAAVTQARSLSDALASAGSGSGIGHAMAMRAAGLGSGRSYFQARLAVERRDPEVMQNLIEQARGMGGDEESNAMYLQRIVREIGGTLTGENALGMIRNGFDANLFPGTSQADAALADRHTAAGGVFGAGQQMARIASQRHAVGEQVSSTAVDLLNRDIQMLSRVLPMVVPVLDKFNEVIGDIIDRFARVNAARESGGDRAAMRVAAEELVDAGLDVVETVLDTAVGVVQAATDIVTDVLLPPESRTGYVQPRVPHGEADPIHGIPFSANDAARHLRLAADALDMQGLPADSNLTSAPA